MLMLPVLASENYGRWCIRRVGTAQLGLASFGFPLSRKVKLIGDVAGLSLRVDRKSRLPRQFRPHRSVANRILKTRGKIFPLIKEDFTRPADRAQAYVGLAPLKKNHSAVEQG